MFFFFKNIKFIILELNLLGIKVKWLSFFDFFEFYFIEVM